MIEYKKTACVEGAIKECPLQYGVCYNIFQTCIGGMFEECDYGPDYREFEIKGQLEITFYDKNFTMVYTDLVCNDTLDNDCDNLTDQDDPGCFRHCLESEICFDGIDNDCDGLIDEGCVPPSGGGGGGRPSRPRENITEPEIPLEIPLEVSSIWSLILLAIIIYIIKKHIDKKK